MKLLIAPFFIFFATLCHAKPLSVWIFAPEIASQEALQIAKAEAELERILNAGSIENVKSDEKSKLVTREKRAYSVKIMNVEGGRSVQWLLKLQHLKDQQWPDWAFYYIPGRHLSKELEVVLSATENEKAQFVSLQEKSELCQSTSSWIQSLLPPKLCEVWGRGSVYRRSLMGLRSSFSEQNEELVFLNGAFLGINRLSEALRVASGHKTQTMTLLSPERVHFFADSLDESTTLDSLAFLLLPDVEMNRTKFKESLFSSNVNMAPYSLLPATFHSLYQKENVIAGSRQTLNQMGVRKWSVLMGNYLLRFFELKKKLEAGRPAAKGA